MQYWAHADDQIYVRLPGSIEPPFDLSFQSMCALIDIIRLSDVFCLFLTGNCDLVWLEDLVGIFEGDWQAEKTRERRLRTCRSVIQHLSRALRAPLSLKIQSPVFPLFSLNIGHFLSRFEGRGEMDQQQQIEALVAHLQNEGVLDEQFQCLMQLQDETNPVSHYGR